MRDQDKKDFWMFSYLACLVYGAADPAKVADQAVVDFEEREKQWADPKEKSSE